ncbi:hypothetical protein KIN20_019825 [Parelaphostrongylus tenuis]|uniref:Uncharacterized protein n=1 Tax=Parelaphostrongylus tenuis TaxID=148309 RepID=A0AAD5MLP1_PARTN|nr:hypothetical protein KIN20_019825 [Parelaphostrongylus tenuis]
MKTVLFALIFCFAFANKRPVVSKKFKLCGNELCDEVLFKAKVNETMNSDHEAFLSLVAGDLIDVTAVKFSDRTDLMEGRLKDGRRGNFYISAIDIGPYIDFLRNAIEIRKEMKKISQDRADIGSKRVLGAERADLHLVRDYNIQATRYAEDQNPLHPDQLPLPDLTATNRGDHEHSHGVGNGRSRGFFHGIQTQDSHSNGDLPVKAKIIPRGRRTYLNGASYEEYRNGHSGEAGHLGTLTSNTHRGASSGHVHSSGESAGEQVKPVPTEKLSTSNSQNSVEMEAQLMKSTSPPIPPTTFSPSESLRKEQQPPDAAAVESGTPQPVLTTTTTLGDQYATTTHSIEKESIPTQGSSVPFAAPISDSTNETVTTPVTYIPAIMDRYTLSSQSTTVSPPPATGHHDFHVNDSNATSDSDAGAQEASTSRKDRLHIDSNMQAALEAAQKPENSIPSGDGIVSPVNDAVPPSTSPGPPQYCTREDCNYQHSKVNGIQKESAHVADHVSCSQSVSNSNDGSNPCNDVRKGEEDHGRSGFIAGILRSLTTFVRSFPYLNDVDNAGIAFVINVSLLMGSIVFHLIWSFFSDSDDDMDISDRMIERLKCELDEERRVRACLENNLTSEMKNTLLANEKATEICRLLE